VIVERFDIKLLAFRGQPACDWYETGRRITVGKQK